MSTPDLFGWSQAEAAKTRLQALRAARAVAAKKAACAPHGQLCPRRAALRAATIETLRAELELARLRQGPAS